MRPRRLTASRSHGLLPVSRTAACTAAGRPTARPARRGATTAYVGTGLCAGTRRGAATAGNRGSRTVRTTRVRLALAIVLAVALVAGIVAVVRFTQQAGRTYVTAYFDNSNGIFTGDDVV